MFKPLYPKSKTAARVDNATVDVYFETDIDHPALVALAQRAARNKSWTAKAGPIRVRVIATQKHEAK